MMNPQCNLYILFGYIPINANIIKLNFQATRSFETDLNALNIYMLVSLSFVMATILEYAIVLLLDQKSKQISARNIDATSAIIFPLFYFIFNLCYWVRYLYNPLDPDNC